MVKAEALVRARYRAGLTRAQLASAAQISTSYLGLLERAGNPVKPSPPVMKRIAEALEVDVEDLVDLSEVA